MVEIPDDIRTRLAHADELLATAISLADRVLAVIEPITRHVDSCDGAAVSLLLGDELVPVAATSERALRLAAVQFEAQEGPGLLAAQTATPISVADLAEDGGFPAFTNAALALQVQCTLAVPLEVDGRIVGVLDMDSDSTAAFVEDEEGALAAAGPVNDVLASSPLYATWLDDVADLEEDEAARATIFQACEWLMANNETDLRGAFSSLRMTALDEGVPIREIARRVRRSSEARV